MTQTICIDSLNGPRFIEAYPIGPFFIHPTLYGHMKAPDDYTVTHAFTGAAVAYQISRQEAERIARILPNLDNWYIGWLDAPLPKAVPNSVEWLSANDIEPAASKA